MTDPSGPAGVSLDPPLRRPVSGSVRPASGLPSPPSRSVTGAVRSVRPPVLPESSDSTRSGKVCKAASVAREQVRHRRCDIRQDAAKGIVAIGEVGQAGGVEHVVHAAGYRAKIDAGKVANIEGGVSRRSKVQVHERIAACQAHFCQGAGRLVSRQDADPEKGGIVAVTCDGAAAEAGSQKWGDSRGNAIDQRCAIIAERAEGAADIGNRLSDRAGDDRDFAGQVCLSQGAVNGSGNLGDARAETCRAIRDHRNAGRRVAQICEQPCAAETIGADQAACGDHPGIAEREVAARFTLRAGWAGWASGAGRASRTARARRTS